MNANESYFIESAPSPILSELVENYWEISNPRFGNGHPILPRGSLDLIFNLSGNSGYEKVLRPTFVNGRTDLQETDDWLSGFDTQNQTVRDVWIAGLHDRAIVVRTPYADSKESVHLVAARLKPLAASLLLNRPASEVTNTVVAARDLFDGEIQILREQLWQAEKTRCRFQILEQFLASKFFHTVHALPGAVLQAAKVIDHRHGLVKVEDLCRTLNVSRKHLSELSKRYLGMSTKRYMRLARYRAAANLLSEPGGHDFAQVAHETGFVDQSHFINEFVRFTGLTPTQVYDAS